MNYVQNTGANRVKHTNEKWWRKYIKVASIKAAEAEYKRAKMILQTTSVSWSLCLLGGPRFQATCCF